MTIHPEHPFQALPEDRDPVRRLRGRIGGAVTLWTSGGGAVRPAGLTVSSRMIAAGNPGHALALVDPDADLLVAVRESGAAVLNLPTWEHRALADAFGGVSPAPGGAFRMADWTDTEWGPALVGAGGWAGLRLPDGQPPREVGWSLLLDMVIEHVDLGADVDPLVHRRGRYQRPTDH